MFNPFKNVVTPGMIMLLYVKACEGQIEPDGKNCAICDDIGHQAFECHHNPFSKFYQAFSKLELRSRSPKTI